MKGNTKAIDYLNKALRHELTAVNQYWLHYRLLDNWATRCLQSDGARSQSRKCSMPTSSLSGSYSLKNGEGGA
jgi:bacterioferritin (cytochrome b1)